MSVTKHNVDQYMSDLRQILAQGKKRIGILLGAGAPVSINVSTDPNTHVPLIPDIAGLTKLVRDGLADADKKHIDSVIESCKSSTCPAPNIEDVLSKLRSLASALDGGTAKLGAYDSASYRGLADKLCASIASIVNKKLPPEATPYNQLAAWMGGIDRDHPVEVFTTNYDLLMEEALEEAQIPFFTGFCGFDEPFFDAASIVSSDTLPARWARVWKLHGSLGWGLNAANRLVAGKGRTAHSLIYPDHLKYDHIQKLPYTALFDRLRNFLLEPDTLLVSCGFSFADRHISAAINEALSANPSSGVFACLYGPLAKQDGAKRLATSRPNFSAYASDGAIISAVEGKWELGSNKDNKDWPKIRATFWGIREPSNEVFLLGDFVPFATFFALAGSEQVYSSVTASATPTTGAIS